MKRLQQLVFWVALAVVLAAAVALGGNRPYVWVPLAIAAFALSTVQTAILLAPSARGRAWPSSLCVAACLYVGVLGWAALQASAGAPLTEGAAADFMDWRPMIDAPWVLSLDPAAGWSGLLRLASYAAFFLIAYVAATDGALARRFVDLVALWGAALAVYGLATHLAGVNPVLGALEAYRSLEATFVNRNAYALYAGFGLLANVASFARRVTSARAEAEDPARALRRTVDAMERGAWIYAAGAALCLIALLLTLSRAGVLVGALGVLVFAALYFRRRRAVSASALRWGGVAAATLASLGVGGVLTRFGESGVGEDARATLFPQLLAAIAERPFTGHGLGAFRDAFRPHAPRAFAEFDWDLAHNSYLENAIELGLVGAAALTLAAVLVWSAALRAALTRRRRLEVPCFAVAAGVAAGAHALVDFSLQMPATTALFAMILGVGAAQVRERPSGPKEPRAAP